MNHRVSFGLVTTSTTSEPRFQRHAPRLSKRQQRELEETPTLAAVSPVKAESEPEEEETMMASGRSGPSKAAPSAFSLVLGSFMESNRPV